MSNFAGYGKSDNGCGCALFLALVILILLAR